MVRVYVAHCPIRCPDRRTVLENNLKSRGFHDVVWVTTYPVSHPMVPWLHTRLGKHLTLGGISGLLKHLEATKMFVEDPTAPDGAIFCDDDTLFVKNWKEGIDQIPPGAPFVNLSVGVNFHFLPDAKPRIITMNNGGCEAYWKSKDLCRYILANVDGRCGMDHVRFAMMNNLGLPTFCIPIAQQTSLLSGTSSAANPTEQTIYEPWDQFIRHFKPTGLSYEKLWNESGIARDDA